jgi:hypothetical protein
MTSKKAAWRIANVAVWRESVEAEMAANGGYLRGENEMSAGASSVKLSKWRQAKARRWLNKRKYQPEADS